MKVLVRIAWLLMLGAVALGCAVAGGPPTAPPGTEPPAATSIATAPIETAISTPDPTSSASPTAKPTVAPSPTEDELPVAPPVAELAQHDGDGVPGRQGSWCYDGACLDGPGLPKSELPMLELSEVGAQLTLNLADSHPFTYWSVGYAVEEGEESAELANGGEMYDSYLTPATPGPWISSFDFESPPPGDWVLRTYLQFGDRGDSTYSWHVTVPD